MRIAIIARATEHSPNMADKDAAILECIASELALSGAKVTTLESGNHIGDFDAICHMSRSTTTLDRLEEAEKRGINIINSPSAVRHCSRIAFIKILQENGIPQPAFSIVQSMEELDDLPYPAWIKKADGWSSHREDVAYASTPQEAKDIFARMQARGIGRAIHCIHHEGDLIKFYSIGDNWFHYSYPSSGKFGLEAMNSSPKNIEFETEKLKETARMAAKAMGLTVYGGDCIIATDGSIHIIDINDFPSFSIVRKEAAKEIAKLIVETSQNRIKDERKG